MARKIWTVGLRNDERTAENIGIALDHSIWGMMNAGEHKNIKAGDAVIFLIGVSINNIDDMRKNPIYADPNNIFPNYKNELLIREFVEEFKFKVDTVLYGDVNTNFFIDNSEVWPPRVTKKNDKKTGEEITKENYYANRFKWTLTHQASDVLLTPTQTNIEFHSNVIKALRSKRLEQSTVTDIEETTLLSLLTEIEPSSPDEDEYQSLVEKLPAVPLKPGPIEVPQKLNANASEKGKWSRKGSMAKSALESANFDCEVDQTHKTFTSRVTNNNFVEAHHLIPMEMQDKIKFSLDVPENILSLCPNCHSMFHHSHVVDVINLLEYFFNQRKERLIERGINITLDELVGFYVKN
ncbi:HNH endonuclease [Aeromonas piscicola]|uniref:HNH endonuclease n=1 Tax=Aeromonas piscicola TaxID=600645 RepID=UPI000AEFFC0E|nr:HNH endonuclease signature motif containing protein [Aeromonas piscicola]